MNLNKAEVARRQLGTALALFLDDFDPVSVHTLACAGGEIAEHLTRKAGSEPLSGHALATFPDLDPKEFRRLRNRYWNAFKHATTKGGKERDDRQLLGKFTDTKNDHALFVGWYDYARAVSTMPIEAQFFEVWYFALNPDRLDPKVDKSKLERHFPNLRNNSRREQKQKLRAKIDAVRKDSTFMGHPRTDPRPLIIAADNLTVRKPTRGHR